MDLIAGSVGLSQATASTDVYESRTRCGNNHCKYWHVQKLRLRVGLVGIIRWQFLLVCMRAECVVRNGLGHSIH